MCRNEEIMATLPEGASQDERRAAFFDVAYSLNVNDKCEKRENLTYLSWANAWAEFKKIYPSATYRIIKNPTNNLPYFEDPNTGLMVYTEVTADGITHEMWLPVMNSSNKAMRLTPYTYQKWDKVNRRTLEQTVEAATMFDINKTLMRCLVKNLAMFGLGLYIYAGEDLPEAPTAAEDQMPSGEPNKPKRNRKMTATTTAAVEQQATTAYDPNAQIKMELALVRNMNELLNLYQRYKTLVDTDSTVKDLFTQAKMDLNNKAA